MWPIKEKFTTDSPSRPRKEFWTKVGLGLLTAWFLLFGARIIIYSLNWPLVQDAPILIYMGFLAEHGMRLYKDVTEVQFPGSILLYSVGRHVFGSSDFGFRIFDLAGLAVAFAAMMSIARRRGRWFAGVFGFAFFLCWHTGSPNSIINLGERDFFVACLVGAGIAFLIEAMRFEKAMFMAAFGFLIALGASIKPNTLLFLVPVLLVAIELRGRGRLVRPYLMWAGGGLAAGVALIVGYLLLHGALTDFVRDELLWLPLYEQVLPEPMGRMIPVLYVGHLVPLIALGSVLLLLMQPSLRKDREQQVLALCIGLGAFAFLSQRKGFEYHLSLYQFFLLLWLGWVLVATLRYGRRGLQWAALALILLGCAGYPHLFRKSTYDMWEVNALQSDLISLHAADQPRQLECLDTTEACITVAQRIQAVTATGYVGGFILFLDRPSPRLSAMRDDFLSRLNVTKPRLIVLSNASWPVPQHVGYQKLASWPDLSNYLRDNYDLMLERGGTAEHSRGYRIYSRRISTQ